MAAGFLDQRANGTVHVGSAGSAPADSINPAVEEAMAEIGIDLAREFPKPLTDDVVRAADTRRTIPSMGVKTSDASTNAAEFHHTKVGVVGVGAVGAATSLALIERGVCRELVLIDKNAARARGVALDMSYAAPLSPAVNV